MKKREEVEAELAKDKEPGGVLAWDRTTKHTPTPWEFDGQDINGPYDGKTVPTVVGMETHQRGYESFDSLVLPGADAQLIVASVNSYAKHCKDPVAAAESDLLGRLLVAYRELHGLWKSNQAHWAMPFPRGTRALEAARELLAETKEGP